MRYKVFLIIFLLIICHTAYGTNGMFPIFMGGQAAGRGGVDFGIANDPSAINTNPAGIGFIHGKMIDFTVAAFFPSINFSNERQNVDADFEPLPAAFFGVVWDRPSQTFEAFSDPFIYMFGGDPGHSDYVFLTGNKHMMKNKYSRNHGQGVFEFSGGNNFELEATGQGAEISEIKLYGYYKSTQNNIFYYTDDLPQFPTDSKISAISVHFKWKSNDKNPEVILEAQGRKEILILKGEQNRWNLGYIALVWEKDTPPTHIRFSSRTGNNLEITSMKVQIGYRVSGSYQWEILENSGKKISTNNINYRLLCSDDKAYKLSGKNPVRISLKKKTNTQKPYKYKVFYNYRLDEKDSGRILYVKIKRDGNLLEHNTHNLAYKEKKTTKLLISRRQADHDSISYERTSGFKFGFGIFPQAGARYNIKVISDLFPEGIDNRSDLLFVSIAPAIAYRFSDRFSIGIAFNFNIEMIQQDGLAMQTTDILQGNPIPGTSTTFGDLISGIEDQENVKGEMDSDWLYGYGFGLRAGFLWKISKRFQFGAVYVSRTWMFDAQGTGSVDYTRYFNSPEISGTTNLARPFLPNQGQFGFANKYDIELEFNLPRRVGAGISFFISDNVLIAADFQWIQYSVTQKKMKVDLFNGDNPDFNALIGGTGTHAEFNNNWKDQYVWSFGCVWQTSDRLVLRAGYNYGNNPVPSLSMTPQLAAIGEHHVTVGGSYFINRYMTLNFAVECALPNRMGSKDDNVIHDAFENSSLEVYTIDAVLGMTMRF